MQQVGEAGHILIENLTVVAFFAIEEMHYVLCGLIEYGRIIRLFPSIFVLETEEAF